MLAIALMVMVAGAKSAYPIVVNWASTLLKEGAPEAMRLVPLGLIGVALVSAISLYGQILITNGIALRVTAQLQNALFGHLLGADFGQISKVPAGQWVSRLTNDVNLVREALTRVLTNMVRDVLIVLGSVGVMLWLDWLLALLIFALYPLATIQVTRIGKTVRDLSTQAQAQLGRMTALLSESLSSTRMVKTYQLENHEQDRAAASFEERRVLGLKLVAKKAQIDPLLEIAGGVAFAAILGFAGWRASTGGAPMVTLLSFIAALAVMAPAVQALGSLNAVWQEGLAALERIFTVLDENPTITESPDAKDVKVKQGAVQFAGVSLSYAGDIAVLDEVSFTAKQGQTVALVGPSGAGKTSVLNLIARLFDADGGEISIDGTPIKSMTLGSLRSAIALVSQDAVLFDGSIEQNIAFGRFGASHDDIIAAAKSAAAHDFILEQEFGYDTQVGERGQRLSGGQQQRIALARALLKDAPILLLDEATSALDAKSEALVQSALSEIAKDRTTIMIAHRLASVRKADIILVLDSGKIVETGRHNDLVKADGLYARLAKEQFGA